jgi:hypothetical protein
VNALKSCFQIEKKSQSPLPSPLAGEIIPVKTNKEEIVTKKMFLTKPVDIKKSNHLNQRASMMVDGREAREGKKKYH